jgi:hypothetical protein
MIWRKKAGKPGENREIPGMPEKAVYNIISGRY